MAELTTVARSVKVSYEGLFDFSHLMHNVQDFFNARGFGWFESQHNEIVKENGKDIYIHTDNRHEVSDYAKSRIVCFITVKNLTDVEIEKDGRKMIVNRGKITFEFEAYVMTDYMGRFEGKPFLYFYRAMLEKFIGVREMHRFRTLVREDMDGILRELHGYLNTKTY
jgi:hypothetical protein